MIALGYNYCIDEIRSALGLVQFRKLEKNNEARRKLSHLYGDKLANLGGLTIPDFSNRGISGAHIYPILLEPSIDRNAFVGLLRDTGIQTSAHYPPVHQFTYYRELGISESLHATEEVGSREVTLPLYPTMSQDQLELVVNEVERASDQVASS